MASKSKVGATTLDELRERITTAQAAIAALDAAPVPLVEALAALTVGVDALSSLYLERLGPLLAQLPQGQPVHELLTLLLPDPRNDPRATSAFFATVMHEGLLSLWRGRLQQLYEQTPSLAEASIPRAERPARRAALRETLRALELQEEVAITEAEARGRQIDRRPDCDPSVLFDPAVLEAPSAA